MNAEEREMRNTLTFEEKDLMQKRGFSISDIVWRRFNADYIFANSPKLIAKYYEDLQSWLLILNSNKRYLQACMVALRIQFIDACGLSISRSLAENKWYYSSPNDMSIINSGSQYLAKTIRLSRVAQNDLFKLFKRSYDAMRPKVPFSFVSFESFKNIILTNISDLNNHGNLKYDLIEFFPDLNCQDLMDLMQAQPESIITGDISYNDDYSVDFSKMPADYGLDESFKNQK